MTRFPTSRTHTRVTVEIAREHPLSLQHVAECQRCESELDAMAADMDAEQHWCDVAEQSGLCDGRLSLSLFPVGHSYDLQLFGLANGLLANAEEQQWC